MQATRFVALVYAMYWWIVRFRAWLVLLAVVIVGAALIGAVAAD